MLLLTPYSFVYGVHWLSGRVLDSRPRDPRFESHRRYWVVSLSKNINPSLELVLTRKTWPFITKRLLMGRKESNLLSVVTLSWFSFIANNDRKSIRMSFKKADDHKTILKLLQLLRFSCYSFYLQTFFRIAFSLTLYPMQWRILEYRSLPHDSAFWGLWNTMYLKISWKIEHLFQWSKCSIFHNIFKSLQNFT